MKAAKLCGLLSVLAILSGTQARAATLTSIGVEFLGRDGSGASGATAGNPPTPGVQPSDIAGVAAVQQAFWNLIDDYNGSVAHEKGESLQLNSSVNGTIVPTSTTLLFDCNDSWYNDVTPTNITSPNAHLMNGIIKSSSGGGVPGVFTFTNVAEGQYDVYIYTDMNGDNTIAKFWDFDGLTTYYVKLTHQFRDTNTFVLGSATDYATATNGPAANYVKFSNLGTYGRGTIGVLGQWVQGNDGIGIAAIQLVSAGPALPNTNAVTFLTQPVNRRGLLNGSNVTFVASTRGSAVTYQWYENGKAIAGATDATYTPAPITTNDSGAAFYVIASNVVNSVISTNAVLTVGNSVSVPGIYETLWYGATRADVEAGLFDSKKPDLQAVLVTFNTPEEQGDNYAERVQCLFTPPAAGNYTFFITSDDNSDLFLSTDATPANKVLIAQETAWSNPLTWLTDDGGGQVAQKRSDQFVAAGGTGPQAPNGYALAAGQQYYLEAVHAEGGGGDNVGVTVKLASAADPTNGTPSAITSANASHLELDGGILNITSQPQNVTVNQGKSASFSVTAKSAYIGDASGLLPGILYQWQTAPQGSSTFTDIAGAAGTSYTTPVLDLTNSLTQYRARVSAAGSLTNSSVAIVTVVNDTNPPVVVGAGVFPGSTQVGLTFNKDLDPTTANNPANYQVNGAAVTSVLVRTNVANETTTEKNLVSLIVPTAINGPFTVTVSGVKDTFGNTAKSNTVAGAVINLTDTDIGSPDGVVTDGSGIPGGDPIFKGSVTQWGPGSFDVLSGGNDYYNNADGFNFLWEPKTNSFDVQVRVVSVSPINNWSAAAIEVREGPTTTNGGGWELARHYFCKVDYYGPQTCIDGSGSGANTYEYNTRLAPGDPTLRETGNGGPGGSAGWGGAGPGNPAPVPVPNAWIRIARVRSTDGSSDHLMGYSSNDGQTWSLRENVDLNDAAHAGFITRSNTPAGPWPSVAYVGLATTAHNNNINNGSLSLPYSPIGSPFACYAIYRNWGDTPSIIAPPTLSFVHNADGTITLTYSGNLYSSTTVSGTYSLVPGATNPYKVTPTATGAAAAVFYRAGP
jgi:hypothetical protein